MFSLASRLFGQDPKLEFRKPGAGVSLLAGLPIAPDDHYWAQYWLLFDSSTDVITLLDSASLSHTLIRRPENLLTLINVLSTHLFSLLALNDFPLGRPGEDLSKEALNCVRVLSRVVPFVSGVGLGKERGAEGNLERTVFWRREKVKVKKAPAESFGLEKRTEEDGGDSQFVIEDEDENEEEEGGGNNEKNEEEEEWEEAPPLATKLLTALVDFMFVPGFTVPEECRLPDGGPISYVIWEPGIAAQPNDLPPTSHALLSARLEILRLLNILLSLPSLLTPSSLFPTQPNPWRDALIAPSLSSKPTLERKVVLCLLCSVLNTALASSSSYSTAAGSSSGGVTGFGLSALGGAAEKLGGVVMRKEDVKGLLIGTCLQFLGILFVDHAPTSSFFDPSSTLGRIRSTSNVTSPFSETGPVAVGMGESGNSFSHYLGKLHRPSDFDFILNGLLDILLSGLASAGSSQSILLSAGTGSGSGKVGWATESLIVLWRIFEINPKLVKRMCENEKMGTVVQVLVAFCLEFKEDKTQLGLVRLSAFMLQTFTAERGWEAQLNGPADTKLGVRAKQFTGGSIADYLILSIYSLIFTTKARLAALYPSFILAIANVSPYFKNLSVVSSTRLVQLFLAFSAPSFLLMEEGNPRLVFYMLETFNNVIHFQLSENSNLIYSIIRSHKRFEELSTFTLAAGVAEVRRVRLERKAAAAVSSGGGPLSPTTPRSPVIVPMKDFVRRESNTSEIEGEDGEEEPVSDKARGKMRERTASDSNIAVAELAAESAPAQQEEEVEVFVGKHGFVPSEGWVSSWREGLPLDAILILLTEFRPHLFDLSSNTELESSEALTYLRTTSLEGLLPPPPPLRPRRFLYTPQSLTWLASVLYGSVYLNALDLLRDVPVQLFAVAQAKRTSSAQELVSGAAAFVMSKVGK